METTVKVHERLVGGNRRGDSTMLRDAMRAIRVDICRSMENHGVPNRVYD